MPTHYSLEAWFQPRNVIYSSIMSLQYQQLTCLDLIILDSLAYNDWTNNFSLQTSILYRYVSTTLTGVRMQCMKYLVCRTNHYFQLPYDSGTSYISTYWQLNTNEQSSKHKALHSVVRQLLHTTISLYLSFQAHFISSSSDNLHVCKEYLNEK